MNENVMARTKAWLDAQPTRCYCREVRRMSDHEYAVCPFCTERETRLLVLDLYSEIVHQNTTVQALVALRNKNNKEPS